MKNANKNINSKKTIGEFKLLRDEQKKINKNFNKPKIFKIQSNLKSKI